MNNLELIVTFVDETTTSYTLDPQTTLAQVRELLKEDEFIAGEELFLRSEQKTFIPKSQEKTKTIQEFQVGDVAKLGIQKKILPKITQEEEKKEDLSLSRSNISSPIKTAETTQVSEKEFAKEIKDNESSSPLEKNKESIIKPGAIDLNLNSAIDVMELSPNDIKNILNKCSYLYGFTLSSDMTLKLGTRRFFDDIPENQRFDKSTRTAMNDLFEKSRVSKGKGVLELYQKGIFDADFEEDAKLIASLNKKNNDDYEDKTPYAYAEIGFPKVSFALSEIRSVISTDVKTFFQANEIITKDKLKKFFETFGAIIPERITIGGKFYIFQEAEGNRENLSQARKLEAELSKGLYEKLFKANNDVFYQKFDDYLLKCVGGDITYKFNPKVWMNGLQKDYKGWEIISIDSWSWTVDYLNDSLRFQMMDLLKTSPGLGAVLGAGVGVGAGAGAGISHGVKTYDNGDYYEGDLDARGKREGRGTMKYANGNYYEGEWKNDKADGQGTFKWANGDMYVGGWLNGVRDGKGQITYEAGDYYEGKWANNKLEGHGKYTWKDGRIYEGFWVNHKREGKGIFKWVNGDVYEGNWVNNKMEGQGKYTWSDNRVYEGGWVNDKREGKGVFKWPGGQMYDGNWVNNKMEGKGKYTWGDGRMYEGDWVNHKKEGKGKFTWANGEVYDGDWVCDKKQGKGKHRWVSGDVYEGDWVNDKRDGKGKLTYNCGDVYNGDWVNNKMDGKGKYTWADGRTYEGDWVNGKKEGKGKFKWVNGETYDGDWVNQRMEGKGKYVWASGQTYDGEWLNNQMKK